MIREINGIDFNAYSQLIPLDGMQIDQISMSEDDFYLHFNLSHKYWRNSDKRLTLWSEPDCCAHHYFTCDDSLEAFIGATLIDFDLRTQPDKQDDCGEVHEISFLIVTTDRGQFTIAAHNEHNGYYGGIDLSVKIEK